MRKFLLLAISAVSAASLAMPSAGAATLEPVQVLTDPALDTLLAETDEPIGAGSDLVGGWIGETDGTIDVSWEVANIEELLAPAPINTAHYWEFELGIPGGPSAMFSVRARMYPLPVAVTNPTASSGDPTWPVGQLQSDCTTSNNLVTCKNVPGAVVTVSVDAETNRVTASMRRQDLKAATGELLAVDGAVMAETDLFQGIATCMTAVVVVPGNACDTGDLDMGTYVLGSAR